MWGEDLFNHFDRNRRESYLEAERMLREFTKASTPNDVLEKFDGVLNDQMLKTLDSQEKQPPADTPTPSAAPTIETDPLGVAADIAKQVAGEVEVEEEDEDDEEKVDYDYSDDGDDYDDDDQDD